MESFTIVATAFRSFGPNGRTRSTGFAQRRRAFIGWGPPPKDEMRPSVVGGDAPPCRAFRRAARTRPGGGACDDGGLGSPARPPARGGSAFGGGDGDGSEVAR